MNLAAFGRNARVPGDHLDATLLRALQHGNERVRIVGGDGDGIDLLGDQRVDDFDLRFSGRGSRSGIDDLDAKFFSRFLGALVGGVKEAVAERLDDQRDAGLVLGHCGRRDHDGNGRRGGEQFQKIHSVSSLRSLLMYVWFSGDGCLMLRLKTRVCHKKPNACCFQHVSVFIADAAIGHNSGNSVQPAQDKARAGRKF